ncbi:MAG: thioredoxin [Treponema sp.]|nr:thioredoxin [Treponema sp.]
MEIELTNSNFEQEVLHSDVPVLVEFWAEWCARCRQLIPIIDEVSKIVTNLKIGKVNAEKETELCDNYNVMSVPTLILFKDGSEIKRTTGFQNKESLLGLVS